MTLTQTNRIPAIEHYLHIKRYPRALELIDQGLAEQPQHAELHFLAARAYYCLDEWEEAETHLQEAFKLGYPPTEIHYLSGHMYTESGQWSKAERAFLDGLHLSPNNPRLHAAYGALLIQTGHRPQGLALIRQAERLDPEDPEVLRHRLYGEIARNHNQTKLLTLHKYMQNSTDQSNALIQMGLTAHFSGDHRTAKEHFRDAYAMNPTNSRMLDNLRLLEYRANPLLFPLSLSDKIGGIPFLWLTLACCLLILHPFYPKVAYGGLIGAAALALYLYLAKAAVLIHQDARDSSLPYWQGCLRSPVILRVLSDFLLLIAVLLIYIPGVWVLIGIARMFLLKTIRKRENQ
ncbi:tetratricopeptide repeat protein [Paenibacillus athensensis]|uniref:Uncharacterized protein n=1 Tax=Paenibacillus athensensis TaxID=1967502 RepID=A0A4Y8Q801_9BACL|nr:tetratricopeptide repeat protein [Paenibacillus athensensis]MCD1257323.1 tetratricopeptide repeat protein [Paenibacillus athensensis]